MRRSMVQACVCIVCAAAMGGCATRAESKSKSKAEKDGTKTVRVEVLSRKDITEVLDYAADILPYAEVRIFSPVPDRILSFPWKDGQPIRRGQLVASVRKTGLEKGLEQVVAQIEGLDAQIGNLEVELARSEGLLAAGAMSQQAFDKLKTSLRSSRAQRRALVASQGQLAVTAGNAVITAPMSGVIAEKMLEVGDMASPQVPLCRIIAIDRVKVQLKLIESDVAKVQLGQPVKIRLNAFPKRTFEGQVTEILPYLNTGTRTNTVEVVLDNPKDPGTDQHLLKPGMYGRAEIVVGKRQQVVTAPDLALLLDSQILKRQKPGETLRKAYVVDKGNTAHQRTVRLGARTGSRYEVLEGLQEGERIVVRGQHGLRDGQKVVIVAAD